jgi:hypothetical protein
MGDDNALVRPGQRDINGQFRAGAQIRRTRRIYDRIKNRNKGEDYNFGELTSFFHRYDEDQDEAWRRDIKQFYTDEDPNIVEKIKQNVITVLSKVNPNDLNPRTSLTIEWYPKDPKGVTMTVDATGYDVRSRDCIEEAGRGGGHSSAPRLPDQSRISRCTWH